MGRRVLIFVFLLIGSVSAGIVFLLASLYFAFALGGGGCYAVNGDLNPSKSGAPFFSRMENAMPPRYPTAP